MIYEHVSMEDIKQQLGSAQVSGGALSAWMTLCSDFKVHRSAGCSMSIQGTMHQFQSKHVNGVLC